MFYSIRVYLLFEKIVGRWCVFLTISKTSNPKFEAKNIEFFKQELMDIGSDKPKLIAFGNAAYDILERNFRDEFEIFKITHYSAPINHDDYRNEVLELCDRISTG